MTAFNFALCGLAAFLALRSIDAIRERQRRRQARSAAVKDALSRKHSSTRGERPGAGDAAPGSPRSENGLALEAEARRIEAEAKRMEPDYGLNELLEGTGVSRAMMGEGGPRNDA